MSSELKRDIIAYAQSLGFGKVGFTSAERLPVSETALGAWVKAGFAGEMKYMEREWQSRARPEDRLAGAKSVISLAASYYNDASPLSSQEGRIARYAWGKDYHKILEKRLDALVRYIEALAPEVRCKTYVDTGPLLERAVAQKAGLGFIGKNTMLITRGLGSYVFLASVITTLELPADGPDTRNCGTCTLCIDACPTQAITEPYHLDARRCIAYLTIESKEETPVELRPKVGEWLFGCDICQEVCPHNTRLPTTPITEFQPAAGVGPTLPLAEVLALKSDAEFTARFAGTPLKRAQRSGLQRNACLVAGNKKRSGLAMLMIGMLGTTTAFAGVNIDDVLLAPKDLSPQCQLISGSHPARNDVQVFYDHGVHNDLLPVVFNTRFQSFRCNKEKGTLYYFEYHDNAQREQVERFARSTLWGSDTQANSSHPETIFHWDRFLMILSFKDMQKELLASLLKKLKPLEPSKSPTASTP